MEIRPIKSEEDLTAAHTEIERLWKAKKGTPEGDRLEVFIVLADAYERERHSLPPIDAVDAIRVRMEDVGWTPGDLNRALGGTGRASEVMNRQRRLSFAMIERLAPLKIPLEILVKDSRRKPSRRASGTKRATLRASARRGGPRK